MGSRHVSVALLLLLCLLLARPSSGVVAESSTPTPTLTPEPSPTPTLTPEPTHTPISVLIVTPEVTPTPPSPWPPEVIKAVATLTALWQAFRWWLIPILLLAGLLALARKVSKELFDQWAKAIAAWIDDRRKNLTAKLRPGPSHDERALLEDIFDRYEYLEMKGFVREKVMIASLESVYVPLFAQGAGEGGRFLRGGELGGLLVRGESGEPIPLSALMPPHRCLVIVGEAGAGKSTFLRHVALTLARALRDRRPALVRQRLDWETDKVSLPIFLPLGGFGLFLEELDEAQKESPNPELLLSYMQHHFRDLKLPEEFFENQLKREEHCLVLLDGLDEVAHFEDRVLISETVALLAQRYERARFAVSCRPEGYRGGAQLGGDFYRADIEPLRWPDDISSFVMRWNEAVLQQSRHAAHENAQDFLHRLEGQERVRALANNPLLLTVMIIVHFNVGQLPERRADLYDNATELLLGWDTRWRRKLAAPPPWLDDIKPLGKRLYLEELAYHWQQQGTPEMRRSEVERFLTPFFRSGQGEEKEQEAAQRTGVFLDWVVERTYLLRPMGDVLSFYRRAFQEYLAARRLAREPAPAKVALTVLEKDWDWWEETLLLAVDHLSASDPARATSLLQAFLKASDKPDTPHRHLILAGRGLADAAREHLPWQLVEETTARLSDAIAQATPAFTVPLRVHAGCALAALGDPRPGISDLFPLLVEVPGGSFPMGSSPEEVQRWKDWTRQAIEGGRYTPPEGWTKDQLYGVLAVWLEAEEGIHTVNVPTFYIARYPVTNAQFAACVEDGGYDEPALWTEAGWAWRQGEGEGWGRPPKRRGEPMYWRDIRFNRPNQPVVGVTWFEAAAYAHWLTQRLQIPDCGLQIWRNGQSEPLNLQTSNLEFRLPTEAEWEKAARGTDSRTWPWGNEWDETAANTAESRGEWTTTPVGLYPGGVSPWGALDMVGNVWEWTSTRWGNNWQKPDYGPPYRPDDGREYPEGKALRVLRGGSWNYLRSYARCADRYGSYPDFWSNNVGLRLVVSPIRSGS
jgi:formylglycine-generating enzyme required for sulfatase activity